MKISYDYEEFIQELKAEFENGLKSSDTIQVLRGNPLLNGYKPVIDWYYNDEIMNEYILQASEVEIDLYSSDKSKLEQLTLHELLEELEEVNCIL